jgi:hypothetical protein
MSTIQIQLESGEQMQKLFDFLRQMRLDFKVIPDEIFSAISLADSDMHDNYKASMLVLADDWDNPENDVWDTI